MEGKPRYRLKYVSFATLESLYYKQRVFNTWESFCKAHFVRREPLKTKMIQFITKVS